MIFACFTCAHRVSGLPGYTHILFIFIRCEFLHIVFINILTHNIRPYILRLKKSDVLSLIPIPF